MRQLYYGELQVTTNNLYHLQLLYSENCHLHFIAQLHGMKSCRTGGIACQRHQKSQQIPLDWMVTGHCATPQVGDWWLTSVTTILSCHDYPYGWTMSNSVSIIPLHSLLWINHIITKHPASWLNSDKNEWDNTEEWRPHKEHLHYMILH